MSFISDVRHAWFYQKYSKNKYFVAVGIMYCLSLDIALLAGLLRRLLVCLQCNVATAYVLNIMRFHVTKILQYIFFYFLFFRDDDCPVLDATTTLTLIYSV